MKTTRSIAVAVFALAVVAGTVFVAQRFLGNDGASEESGAPATSGAESNPESVRSGGAAKPAGGAGPRTSGLGADARKPESAAGPKAAGSPKGDEGERSGAVVGRVVDPNGAPIAGARARVARADGSDSATASSDESGSFRVADAPAGPGLELVIEHEDHLPLTVPDLAVLAGASLDVGEKTLEFGARVEGIVVDGNGSPLPGATVRLVAPFLVAREGRDHGPRQRVTGEDGAFRFSGLSGGECFLLATAPSHVASAPQTVTVKENGLAGGVRVRLSPGRVVAGRVVGPDGAGVAGASVRVSGPARGGIVFSMADSDSGLSGARTGANGEFEIREAPEGPCTLSVRAEGFARAEAESSGGSTDVVVSLQRMGTIQGIVFDSATGDPVPDFEAWAEPSSGLGEISLGSSKTRFGGHGFSSGSERVRVSGAADGRFEIGGLDPGSYVVRVEAKGAAPGASETVTVPPAPAVAETTVRLERGGAIEGVVREEGTGLAIEGATVLAVPSKGGGEEEDEDTVTVISSGAGSVDSDELFMSVAGEATTDAAGAFAVEDLRAGTYRLVVRHPDHARGDLAGLGVSAGERSGPVTIVLGAAGGIEGYVSGMNGEPVAGAPVTARNAGGLSRTAKSDASGYYKIPSLTPGTYYVKRDSETPGGMRFVGVMRRSGAGAAELPKPEGVAAEVTALAVTRVDFSDADLASIAGRLVDGEKPVAGASVHLTMKGAMAMPNMTQSDEEGGFAYERLDPGSYVLEVRVPPDSRSILTETVELAAGRRVERDFVLPTGAIEGKVLDKLTHDPVAGARVAIESLDEKPPGGVRMAFRVGGGQEGYYSESDGTFRIPFVAAGKYRVTAAKDGYGQESIEPVQLMEAGDVASNCDIQLSPGCSLSGRVVDAATEAPLARAFVQGRDESGRPLLLAGSVMTDSDGRFRLSGLRPGAVSLSVFHPEHAPWSGSATVAAKGESTITVPMKMEGE